MSAHAYWRLEFAWPGYSGISFQEIEMRGAVGGADLCTGGTASGSFSGAANAFDNDSGTSWSNAGTSAWIQYQFASPGDVREFVLVLGNTTPPATATLKCSDDGSVWDTVGTWAVSRAHYAGSAERFMVDGQKTYWRIVFTKSQSQATLPISLSLAEVEMRSVSGGANKCSGGAPLANAWDYGGEPWKAFDSDSATHWSAYASPPWLGYHFAEDVSVAEYALTEGFSTSWAPKDFTLEYSADGINWSVADTRTGESAWSASETRVYSVTLPGAYSVDLTAEVGVGATLDQARVFAAHLVAGVTAVAQRLRSLGRRFLASLTSGAGLTVTPIIGQAIQLIASATAGAFAGTRRMLARAVTGPVAVEGAMYRALYRLRSASVAADATRTRTVERLRSASLAIAASAAVQAARARTLSAAVSAAIVLRRAVPFALVASVLTAASASKRAVQARLLSAAVAVGAATSRLLARSLSAGATVAAGVSRFLRLARAAGVQATSALRATSARLRPLATGVAAGVVLRTRSVLMQALQAGASTQARLSLVGLRLLRATVSAGAASHRAFLLVRRVGVRAATRLRRALTATLTAGVAVIGQVVADLFVVGRLLGQAMMRPAIGAAAAMRSLLDATGRMVARLRGSVRTKDD